MLATLLLAETGRGISGKYARIDSSGRLLHGHV
jgi:hypothetical protein